MVWGRRVMSSRAELSILMTCAPSSANISPAKGPAAWTEKSATRTPDNGPLFSPEVSWVASAAIYVKSLPRGPVRLYLPGNNQAARRLPGCARQAAARAPDSQRRQQPGRVTRRTRASRRKGGRPRSRSLGPVAAGCGRLRRGCSRARWGLRGTEPHGRAIPWCGRKTTPSDER